VRSLFQSKTGSPGPQIGMGLTQRARAVGVRRVGENEGHIYVIYAMVDVERRDDVNIHGMKSRVHTHTRTHLTYTHPTHTQTHTHHGAMVVHLHNKFLRTDRCQRSLSSGSCIAQARTQSFHPLNSTPTHLTRSDGRALASAITHRSLICCSIRGCAGSTSINLHVCRFK